ncbi:zinc-binding dehydrogenase [Streptomyces violaceusniger]
MRSVVYSEAGDAAAVARVEDIPEPPAPGVGEVQVAVSVSPVHRGDLVGTSKALSSGVSMRALGTEAAGVVTAVGESVSTPRVGDRVAVFPAVGAWSERVTVPAEAAVIVPETVSEEIASIALVNSVASRDVLRAIDELRTTAAVPDEAPLVVSAAASAVGKLIVRQAIDRGWEVIAVVRSERSAATVHTHFPDTPVVVTQDGRWQRELARLIDGRPVPVISDAHGGPFVQEILPFLADAGTLVVWGDLAAQPWTLATMDLLMRELKVRAVSISRWMSRPDSVRAADREAALELAERHPELLAVHATYSLEELGDAINATRTNGSGSVLLTLN